MICLNHNPANVRELLGYPWQWMLSGHTHGRQVATSKFGQAFYPHRFRRYTHGYYSIGGRHLYVNRGLSYGQRDRQWCRPEISVFKLSVAEGFGGFGFLVQILLSRFDGSEVHFGGRSPPSHCEKDIYSTISGSMKVVKTRQKTWTYGDEATRF